MLVDVVGQEAVFYVFQVGNGLPRVGPQPYGSEEPHAPCAGNDGAVVVAKDWRIPVRGPRQSFTDLAKPICHGHHGSAVLAVRRANVPVDTEQVVELLVRLDQAKADSNCRSVAIEHGSAVDFP